MSPHDPNLAKVELAAHALGALRERLVFVGGCAVGLLLSDPGAAQARVTYDVDLVVEVATHHAYHDIEAEFSRLGFAHDVTASAPICRWRYRDLQVDLMPSLPHVLGFANRWYPLVMETAQDVSLPSGLSIRLISAPLFIASKFEAFADRGNGDVLASHDLEDIINVVDGRTELLAEIGAMPFALQSYLAEKFSMLLAMPNFMNYLPGMLPPDAETLAERLTIVAERLALLAENT